MDWGKPHLGAGCKPDIPVRRGWRQKERSGGGMIRRFLNLREGVDGTPVFEKY
ncbi:MAG: hypothetical protein LBO68_00745 [Synergistaceae bacterium]|nr:hypothetical protein [Synergistaceae bacterium]